MNHSNLRKLFTLPILVMLVACNNADITYMVGTLERDRVEVSVESNEPIIAIHVTDGQMLKTGELILEQDPCPAWTLPGSTDCAKGSGCRDAWRSYNAVRDPRPSGKHAPNWNPPRLQPSMQRQTWYVQKKSFERDLSDQSTLDFATTRWKTATAAEKAAGESLDRLLNGTTIEELQQAIAALAAAEAGISQIQLNIERLKIYAPGRWHARQTPVSARRTPQIGATIAVILDAARTYARIYVPEPLRASVQPGKKLNVRIAGHAGTITGTVRWVSADATFTPYFALTEHDRSRLSYLAEVDVPGASDLPSGIPLEVDFPASVLSKD